MVKVSFHIFVNDMQYTINFYNKLGLSVTRSVKSPEDDLVWTMALPTGLENTFYGAVECFLCDNNNYMLTFAGHE